MRRLEVAAPEGFPDIVPGDDLPQTIAEVLRRDGPLPQDDDVLVVAQKVVSKAEGSVVNLAEVTPSPRAVQIAAEVDRDPRMVEVVLRESRAVVRTRPGLIIAEHRLGFICANAGVDHSNVGLGEDYVTLLPRDPDASAAAIREAMRRAFGADVAVLINDTHGRPFREGVIGVCIGAAGMSVLSSYIGQPDRYGYLLRVTIEAVADELSSAATLLMGQADEGRPLVLIRGARIEHGEGGAAPLVREPSKDMFR
ncbi:MAG: coenzyme F420-0:L-glutamate ligase [Armatimonadetes bacterium]|nr:coenzyme F420-0:L-glutamate ligase [Armatimonadota bacterium]